MTDSQRANLDQPRGVTTTNSYSAAGDLSGVTYSDSTPAVSLGYDLRGRPSSVTQGSLTTSLTMNDLGQLLGESYSGGDLAGLAVTNIYDSLFRRTNNATLLNGASLGGVSFTYATASRLDTVSDGTNAATYAYLANSPLVSSVTFKQSGTTRLTTTKSYDNLNRLTQISSVPSADSTVSFNYAYNSANQRTSVTNADSSRWLYQYDTLGQVTLGKRYWSDGTIVAGQQFEYGFDDIGNRKSAASGGDQWGANLRYAYYNANNLNQYTNRTAPGSFDVIGTATNSSTVTVNNQGTSRKADYYRGEQSVDNSAGPLYLSVTNVGVVNNGPNGLDIVTNKTGNFFVPQTPESFKYDADGNLTNDGRWSLAWDAENRLITMTANANVPTAALKKLDFGYDYRARRITKKISTWTGSAYVAQSTNKFLYDDWNLVAEVNNTNSVIRSYSWGLDLGGTMQGAGGVGGLVSVNIVTNGIHFAAYDGNGNVRGLISTTNGTITGNYEYDPFGETLRAEGAAADSNPWRFSTKFADDDSDLDYYGYRYYNPYTGRWLNRDPIGEAGGMNIQALARNEPLSQTDARGLAFGCSASCECVSATVTSNSGGGGLTWGWLGNGNGTWRFGTDMHVVWKVKGDATKCHYFQNESGEFAFYNLSNINDPRKQGTWSRQQVLDDHGTAGKGVRDYIDRIGGFFFSPQNDGDWISVVTTAPSITLECVGSDNKTTMSQPVTVSSPPNPGTFPPPR